MRGNLAVASGERELARLRESCARGADIGFVVCLMIAVVELGTAHVHMRMRTGMHGCTHQQLSARALKSDPMYLRSAESRQFFSATR